VRALTTGLVVLASIAILGATGILELNATIISDGLGWCLLGVSALVFSWLIFFGNWSPDERKKSAAILVLFIGSSLFWAGFEQAGSSLSLFAERNTNRLVPGFVASILGQNEFPASWFQQVQPIFVIALAPVFAILWLRMGRREPSSPAKFTIGLLFDGLAFVLMIPAAMLAVSGRMVSPLWLTGCYFLQTVGELSLSPVGLSAMSKLAPDRAAGLMMGIWFLSISIGNWGAGKLPALYSAMPLPSLFGAVAAFSIAAAVLLALLIKPTVRLMGGVK